MASKCGCQAYCETHGREFVMLLNGEERCSECMADGWSGEFCSPCHESSFGQGEPDPSDLDEMKWMCEEHKEQKLQFIQELLNDN